jgi:hypothetical protein
MSRRWIDSRDGTPWLVDALPFDLPAAGRQPGQTGWSLLFVSPKVQWMLPVGYELGTRISQLKDPELAALLDVARTREGEES